MVSCTSELQLNPWTSVGHRQEPGDQKLDNGWPESEEGDCQAIPSKEIVKIELSKSHDFFIQFLIE